MINHEQVLFETTTELEFYQVVERQYEGRPARVLFSGRRRAAQSGVGLDDNPDLLFDYNQRLLELANAVYPKRVLVIGGGAFSLPIALVSALPDAIIDVAELDPGLEQIARDYFGLQTNDRLNLYFGDGREFLTSTTQTYDLIVMDVYSELSVPEAFLTAEFVNTLQAKTTANGVVGFNIIASYQGKNAGLIKGQIAAYQAAFGTLEIFPAGYGLSSWLPQNLVLVAQKQPVSDLQNYLRYAPITMPEASAEDVRHDN